MSAPRWSRLLLTWLAPRWRRDDIVGDLEEMHARYRRQHGAAGAWWRSSRDAATIAAGFVGDRAAAINGWATWPDVRLGLRQIRQSPALSITAILALATGIGMATIGFALLDSMLYSTLPFPNGDRFVRIEMQDDSGSARSLAGRYADIVARVPALDHVGAVTGGEFNLLLPSGEIEPLRTNLITPRSLRHLPGMPMAGRPLIDADGQPGAPPVALLSERLWRRRFDADPRVVGRTIDVAGVPRLVVGVMPDGFEFATRPELWLPLDEQFLGGTAAGPAVGVRIFGVLREGASLESANAQLRAIASGALSPGQSPDSIHIVAKPYGLETDAAGIFFTGVVVILVLMLLVVAANIATLVAARGWARSTELAVRTALGAGRSRIVGQLFVEVLVLGLIAAVIGAAGAHLFLGWLEATIVDIPFWIHFAASPRTMGFVVLVTIAASAVAGVLPAVVVTRGNLAGRLQAGRTVTGGFGRTARALIIVEVALSVALLSGAVAMARGFLEAIDGTPAIDESHILAARITAGPLQTGAGESTALQSSVVDAVRTVTGVIDAGAASHVPRRDAPAITIRIEWPGGPVTQLSVPGIAIGPGFLDALDSGVTRGRPLSEADARPGAAPVALVNESFVASILGGRNPMGLRLNATEPGRGGPGVWREIVGVVPDLGMSMADRSSSAGFYVPRTGGRSFRMVIRTAGDPRRVVPSLRSTLAALDPALQVRDVMPLAEVGWEERTFMSGLATAMIALGGVALLLAVVSVYALLSFAVTQRTREFGIRMALGASRGAVLSNVLRASVGCLSIGVALGVGLGVLLLQARGVVAFRVPTGGVWSVLVALPLVAGGIVACWVPARRALRIQPAEALRQ